MREGHRHQGRRGGEPTGRQESALMQEAVERAEEKPMWFNKDKHKGLVLGRNKWLTSWVRNHYCNSRSTGKKSLLELESTTS